MRVVLLGAGGQLGTDLRRAHAEVGGSFELVPLSRDKLDVTAPELEEQLGDLRFDVLVNCTGYHRTDEAEGNASAAFAVNAHAVQRMACACARRRARLVHISTDYVFGGDTERRNPFEENDPMAPVNVYGASKALGETLARQSCEDVVVLRIASLFGVAGASAKGGNFVETILRLARQRRELTVVDDQVMSPTASADVAAVMLRMLSADCERGTWHVVNGGAATWYEFAREILSQAGRATAVVPCSSADYPSGAARPKFSVLRNAKCSATWGALAPWQEALERYLATRN